MNHKISKAPCEQPLSQEPAGRGGGEAQSVVSDSVDQVGALNSESTVAAEDGGVDFESLTVQEDSEVAEMLQDNEVPSQW